MRLPVLNQRAVRVLVLAAAFVALAFTMLPARAAQTPSVINVYTDSDTNISDWLANIVGPAFEKKFPQYKVKVVTVRGVGNGVLDIANRALAAMQSNADPQAEVFDFNVLGNPDLIKAGLWQEISEKNVPNIKNYSKAAANITPLQVTYRGSQVLLAYDSKKIKDNEVPRTFPDLVKWIKAHSGQFVYCRPDKGGSGGNFVVRALYEVTGKNPALFVPGEEKKELIDQYGKVFDLLREIHPFIYDNGSYPAGNLPVLQLLANGEVSLISAWSDQALQGISKGTLPDTVKLAQLTDLPFPGSYVGLAIPKNTKNLDGALAFVNFMLSAEMQVTVIKEIGGFPAVGWDTLPKDLQTQFTSVIADNVPNWPGGKYGAPLTKGWYEQVATNIKPDPTATPKPATPATTTAPTAAATK